MKKYCIKYFYDDEDVAGHTYETLKKAHEMFQKVIAHIHNDVNIDDGHHRVLLLVEEYDGCNVAIETRVKEMMFFKRSEKWAN